MADFATLLRDHVRLTCRSIDRIFLQAYVPAKLEQRHRGFVGGERPSGLGHLAGIGRRHGGAPPGVVEPERDTACSLAIPAPTRSDCGCRDCQLVSHRVRGAS